MNLSLEEKIGLMCGVGFDALTPPDYILDWLRAGRVRTIVLFARNAASPAQLAELTQALREAAPYPIFICIDQEGGRVARLRTGFTESPGAMALGAADSEPLAERVAAAMGEELLALGINWNLAPVLDVAHNAENPVIGTRSLGSDPDRVARLAAAQIRGFQRAGVAATAKHFPGHGNTLTDSHVALPVVRGEIEADLLPYRAAIAENVASVMVSHLQVEAIDPDLPATLSPKALALLRNDLGYAGMVCTDCMEMRAMRDHFGVGESAVLAAIAGVDLMFFSHTRDFQEQAYEALLVAAKSGRLTTVDESAQRVQAVIDAYPPALRASGEAQKPEHLTVMQEAARAATIMLRSDLSVIPLAQHGRMALIEFASYLDSEAMDRGGLSSFGALFTEQFPGVEAVSMPATKFTPDLVERAKSLASSADVLILTTRNAHLWQDEMALARELANTASNVVLICLANPYDAAALDAPSIRTVLCTCGDSTPSLKAAVDALAGVYQPMGRLPVAQMM